MKAIPYAFTVKPTFTHILPDNEDPQEFVNKNIKQYIIHDTIKVVTPERTQYFKIVKG